MSEQNKETLEESAALAESINQRLNCIYNQLCDYEKFLNEQNPDDGMQLMQLLESVDELHASARQIRSHNDLLRRKQSDLQLQMQLLKRSVELLKLEN